LDESHPLLYHVIASIKDIVCDAAGISNECAKEKIAGDYPYREMSFLIGDGKAVESGGHS
jgi:hypothetical protein